MTETVLVLNDYCHINGGASRVAIDEAVALSKSGLKVIFLGANGPVCKELAEAAIEVVNLDQPELLQALRSPGILLQGLWNRTAARATAKILDGLDPAQTIVHLHGYTKALSTSPVRVASGRGFHVVCTLHDFFAACPNGAFFDYTANTPCQRRALSLSCLTTQCDKRSASQKAYRVVRSLAQRAAGSFPASVHHYISLSRRSTEILRPYLPEGANIYPLGNMIPVEQRPRVDVGANRNIVAIGRLDREKGVEVLLEASRASGVPILFVGEGPLRPMVEATPGCRVTGWLDPAGVEREIEQARAVVFPSLWYETFGLVVSEAAAKGVPSIVSDVSAASERVRHGETGWVMRSGDAVDLAGRLRELADDDLVARVGRQAYEAFWRSPPDRKHHVAGLVEIYRAVLETSARAVPQGNAMRTDAGAAH